MCLTLQCQHLLAVSVCWFVCVSSTFSPLLRSASGLPPILSTHWWRDWCYSWSTISILFRFTLLPYRGIPLTPWLSLVVSVADYLKSTDVCFYIWQPIYFWYWIKIYVYLSTSQPYMYRTCVANSQVGWIGNNHFLVVAIILGGVVSYNFPLILPYKVVVYWPCALVLPAVDDACFP